MKPIRSAVKALIIHDDKLLAIKCKREQEYYILPGGGQESGENMKEALIRECREELGCEVECRLLNGENPRLTDLKDDYQTGIEWLPLSEISDRPIYPKIFRQILRERDGRIYLGDTN